ncbi:amino acid ABC transporter permease [Varunaivibrio sulfuroxidans]|uniref:Amino acid ABC transporter membrane protein 2 (PAAT family) n=1 Tax=Varunaivibrio sulfuroxidans TaxID=1773489 RepID=A0A4R3JFP4_9PROT|nr:amino acid ABC transporter permease [Varunaivibrio sulfuroxidans]TCS64103.1 amino acid ABC transporter membrane protein 2 (PAAT family) [Varunaivibrio sulfuroxidans]WES31448.1 amino acid ABC transporter permease [Varunaivibrio sulfuroxidans]
MPAFQPLPDMPPPIASRGAIGWVRENLLSSPLNVALTLAALYLIFSFVPPIVNWAIINANFAGNTQAACTAGGACWVFVKSRITLFIYGFYPADQYWRINSIFLLMALTFAPQFFNAFPYKKIFGIFALIGIPVVGYVLISGGMFGLQHIETEKWGGLMLTLVLAYAGIIAALPIGIVLALGRRSEMPVIRSLCIGFIELWRGVPLITVLFMASVMLPMFLPEGVNFNKLLRALIGIILFESAYIAEVVRGGLQAIPKGQSEAASALGLNYWKSMGLIILPQALKLVIPGIVNTFIALFKDTTLVLIIGLFDVLGAVQSAITDPSWRSVSTEGYLFAAFCFWIFCFSMSRYSQALERKLYTGHKR